MFDTDVPKVDFITELVATSRCETQCKCWAEIDEFGTINTANCLKICDDDYDQRCLNLPSCLCDLHSLQLVCNNTDDSYEETPGIVYKCQMRISPQAGTTELPSVHFVESNQRSTEKKEHRNVIWWIVGGLFCGLLVLATIATLGWRFLKNNQELGGKNSFYH